MKCYIQSLNSSFWSTKNQLFLGSARFFKKLFFFCFFPIILKIGNCADDDDDNDDSRTMELFLRTFSGFCWIFDFFWNFLKMFQRTRKMSEVVWWSFWKFFWTRNQYFSLPKKFHFKKNSKKIQKISQKNHKNFKKHFNKISKNRKSQKIPNKSSFVVVVVRRT